MKLWDPASGRLVQTLAAHKQPVYSIAFSPDGNYIASGSFDKMMCVWSIREGRMVRRWEAEGSIFEVDWNASGDKLAACYSKVEGSSAEGGNVAVIDWRG